MGDEVSEQLHIEVKASVLQHVRFKYACRHCERHADGTPLYLMDRALGRADIEVGRGTLTNWIIRSAEHPASRGTAQDAAVAAADTPGMDHVQCS
jgi:transposase